MPRTTRDDEPPVEPPPTRASAELAEAEIPSLPAQFAGRARRDERPLVHCTEAELLGVMALQELDADAARDAWSELYCRHSRYVGKVAARALGERSGDSDAVADVVNDAFHSVFDWAGRQSKDADLAERFDAPDRDVVRSKVLAFLATVTRRLVAHTFTGQRRAPREFLHDDIDEMSAGADEDTEPPPTPEHSKLDAVLELLSSDEAEALRVSLPWYQPETGEFSFPRGEAARVAASLGITPDTLRQRRCRSLKRLQSLLVHR